MRGIILAAVMGTLACGTVLLADDAGLKALEGSYKIEALTKGNPDMGVRDVPEEVRKNMSVNIKADVMTLKVTEKNVPAKIKVDSSKTPMTIDISPMDGAKKGETFPGIYKLEKDELIIAFIEKDKAERPTDFKPEGEVAVMKLKKDEKK